MTECIVKITKCTEQPRSQDRGLAVASGRQRLEDESQHRGLLSPRFCLQEAVAPVLDGCKGRLGFGQDDGPPATLGELAIAPSPPIRRQ